MRMVYILTGVSGVGKTTIGRSLAQILNIPFYDADDFHPASNISKMKNGIPLRDEDRWPWLETLAANIKRWKKRGAVLACSALKESYRKKLISVPEQEITWIFLNADYEVILKRMQQRKDHYFKPELLKSQFETLEIPDYGLKIKADQPIESVINEIMSKLYVPKSEIGVLGLGVMGGSLAVNMAGKGIKVSVFNRQYKDIEVDVAEKFALAHKDISEFPWHDDLQTFVSGIEKPRKILIMVKAGKTVDLVIKDLIPLLEQGDLIIDGGNSHFKDTLRRKNKLKSRGILYLGTGISGGEEGARKGPSIMPGGSPEAYQKTGHLLEKIAARDKYGKPCCSYIGPDGAGHFVKMLHNGIEYAEMQLIAEIYHFLRYGHRYDLPKIAGLFEDWNLEMNSYLLEISSAILREKENDEFLLDLILDAAGQKGTGGWSTNAALELGVPLDTITAAVMARNISSRKKQRLKLDEIYRPFAESSTKEKISEPEIFSGYKAASIINHAIGFDLLKEASREYKWDLDLSEISRIWTNGCIIRSTFMEELEGIFSQEPDNNLLVHNEIIPGISSAVKDLTKFTAAALTAGFPLAVSSAALNYFLSFTSGQSSANMIQAQRDFFGAHGFERTDRRRGEYFHHNWKPLG